MISLERIRATLAAHSPQRVALPRAQRAAVALVLREPTDGAEMLFIERVRRDGDPWSGHMAFPGGRVQTGDAGSQAAAERETREEVGLDLEVAELLGPLGEQRGNPLVQPGLVVSAYVYRMDRPGRLTTNDEVQEAFWFPVAGLLDPARHVHYTTEGELEYPAILVGEPDRHVIWGLTYRFLETFFHVLGQPLPDRWTGELRRFARVL